LVPNVSSSMAREQLVAVCRCCSYLGWLLVMDPTVREGSGSRQLHFGLRRGR
jgi:hypothetical protein